jgi:hypothetical protein
VLPRTLGSRRVPSPSLPIPSSKDRCGDGGGRHDFRLGEHSAGLRPWPLCWKCPCFAPKCPSFRRQLPSFRPNSLAPNSPFFASNCPFYPNCPVFVQHGPYFPPHCPRLPRRKLFSPQRPFFSPLGPFFHQRVGCDCPRRAALQIGPSSTFCRSLLLPLPSSHHYLYLVLRQAILSIRNQAVSD